MTDPLGVSDHDGKPVPPYTFDQCTPVVGNQLQGQITWGKHRTIDSSNGQPLRLVFELTNAKLYSFWIRPTAAGSAREQNTRINAAE